MKKPFFVTFYSYKGGVGRTCSLANVAYFLANDGNKVVLIDFDLEAPGLHKFFNCGDSEDGVLDIIYNYMKTKEIPDIKKYVTYGKEGIYKNICFIPAGKMDSDYTQKLGAIDWDLFYDKFYGYRFIEYFKNKVADLWDDTDFVLIDSRTGENDIAAICTHQIPDCMVMFFALNKQNEEGIKKIYNRIKLYCEKVHNKDIFVIPVASPVGQGESELKQERLRIFKKAIFEDQLILEIPYHPRFFFEEVIIARSSLKGEPLLWNAHLNLVRKINQLAKPAVRSLFISLPQISHYKEFLNEKLIPSLNVTLARIRPVTKDDIDEGRWLDSEEETIGQCNAMIIFYEKGAENVEEDFKKGKEEHRPIIAIHPPNTDIPQEWKEYESLEIIGSELNDDLIKMIDELLYKNVIGIRDYAKSDLRRSVHRKVLAGFKKKTAILFSEDKEVEKSGEKLSAEDNLLIEAKHLYEQKRFMDAVKLIDDYLKQNPECDNEEINFLLSDCWFLEGENELKEWRKNQCYENFLKTTKECFERCPDSLLIKKNLGIAYIKNKRFEEGKTTFNELIKTKPDSTLFHYDLACIAAYENKIDKVLEHLKKAISIDPEIKTLARIDPDFDKVWRNPEFQKIIFQS